MLSFFYKLSSRHQQQCYYHRQTLYGVIWDSSLLVDQHKSIIWKNFKTHLRPVLVTDNVDMGRSSGILPTRRFTIALLMVTRRFYSQQTIIFPKEADDKARSADDFPFSQQNISKLKNKWKLTQRNWRYTRADKDYLHCDISMNATM